MTCEVSMSSQPEKVSHLLSKNMILPLLKNSYFKLQYFSSLYLKCEDTILVFIISAHPAAIDLTIAPVRKCLHWLVQDLSLVSQMSLWHSIVWLSLHASYLGLRFSGTSGLGCLSSVQKVLGHYHFRYWLDLTPFFLDSGYMYIRWSNSNFYVFNSVLFPFSLWSTLYILLMTYLWIHQLYLFVYLFVCFYYILFITKLKLNLNFRYCIFSFRILTWFLQIPSWHFLPSHPFC